MLNFLSEQWETLSVGEPFKVVFPTLLSEADALTVVGCVPVRGLHYILNHPEKFIAIPLHKEHLPRDLYNLYGDVLYLRPFADVAEAIRAPFGVDTVYAVKRREPKPRTGAYKLPAPTNR
jgi:hypothetical protein